jgi:hypothetical protein
MRIAYFIVFGAAFFWGLFQDAQSHWFNFATVYLWVAVACNGAAAFSALAKASGGKGYDDSWRCTVSLVLSYIGLAAEFVVIYRLVPLGFVFLPMTSMVVQTLVVGVRQAAREEDARK